MGPEVREVQRPLTPNMFLPYPVRTLRASLSPSAHWGAWGLAHRGIMRIPGDGGHPGLEHSLMHSFLRACIHSHSKHVLRICLGQGQWVMGMEQTRQSCAHRT